VVIPLFRAFLGSAYFQQLKPPAKAEVLFDFLSILELGSFFPLSESAFTRTLILKCYPSVAPLGLALGPA